MARWIIKFVSGQLVK
ncbi:hypothetical protein M6B38_417625 [Iris pallida]|uniref:Uncharacterized protein n=1 Tax=Iris pallida TaxID=29817 RepID=A0AAX6FJL1_IRIPA|nr:hypothetical protein M6B38_417625 [Iris pallida]